MNTPQVDPVMLKRAKAYLAKMAGMQGTDDSPGVKAAGAVILGFNLGIEVGESLLKSDYAPRCSPRLSDQQVNTIALRAISEHGNQPVGQLANAQGYSRAGLSDLGNARYLVQYFGEDLRYCHEWETWFIWDGTCWRKDRTGAVVRKVIDSLHKHQRAALRGKLSVPARKKLVFHLLRSEAAPRIKAILEIAQNLEPVPIVPEQFDVDPWKLNCLNGTLDLRTGNLHSHQRRDLITKIVPFAYDPKATCPQWLKFLEKIMAGNKAVIEFIQRLAGYSVTGVVTEHCMAILYGDGKNGKSTYIEIIRFVLNNYAIESAPGLLVEQRNPSHPTEIADLHGARFASNSEVGQGQKLDEAKFKRLTGGDRLKARKMYQDFYEFYPTHKFWMCTNHMLVIRETKEAIWRRIFLIPFLVVIPDSEVDKTLADKLKAEALGILAWMIRGCLAWQKGGLNPPPEVQKATTEYRKEMDVVGQYISESCIVGTTAKAGASELYRHYKQWCEDQGLLPFSQKRFGTYLKSQPNLKDARDSAGKVQYEGIRLRNTNDVAPQPTVSGTEKSGKPAVSPEEFQNARGVHDDDFNPIEIDATRLYQAYFDYCEEVGRPKVTMAEVDEFYAECGFPRQMNEDGTAYFRGVGLRTDFPDGEPSEPSAGDNALTALGGLKHGDHPSDPSAHGTPPLESSQEFGRLIE